MVVWWCRTSSRCGGLGLAGVPRLVEPLHPDEACDYLDAWGESAPRHPGIWFLGTDGSSVRYVVDLCDCDPSSN